MEMKRNDPFSWLNKTGIASGNKKTDAVKVRGHTRGKPGGKESPTSIEPDGHPNPAMKSPAVHHMTNEKQPGAAMAASRTKSGAKGAATSVAKSGSAEAGVKHEAGESAAYEKMEEKTLKGLKGPKSKILKEGHNTSMKLGGGGRFKAIEKSAAASGAKNPAAVAAAAGIKKYGAKKMSAMAQAGKKRKR